MKPILISDNKILVTVNEVIATLGIGRNTIYRLVNEGKLPIVKVGARTYFKRADLEAFIESCTRRVA